MFKEAVGKAITEFLSSFISSNKQLSKEMNAEYGILNKQVQLEYLKISKDPDAYERFMKMVNK
ncbi:hypothetical protein HXA34_03670 [Salipaludibacillus agaradhaerens]|jgi:hypothetical protein|uniref:hypothetical protein n=1 Tax=Salipaludibacillus agaradhaerens TaxID=76935 RepID=UPI002150A955|nr:hypothetical protein [Salipaludibacillus agaradhaerens]MCR6105377.1 hypothetical protein [Salipaludibacillus agaradhaerens]MCR6117418.1 hypothetical protein [Salipaludibacillus agaradhaerens]